MKKFLRSIFTVGALAMGAAVSAQTAPNVTMTDINGTTHRLYEDYLDKGIAVVVDISATWCGPCWSYHQGHALKDAYNQTSRDQLQIFFIEGDHNTGSADLNGTGGNTYGNWVSGTPYPIVDDRNAADQFGFAAYPTIYMICPDRSMTNIGQASAASIVSRMNNCPGLGNGGGGGGGSHDLALVPSAYGGLRTVCPGDDVSFWTWVSSSTKPDSYTMSAKANGSDLASNTITPSANWNNGEWGSPGTATINNTTNIEMVVEVEGDPDDSNNSVSQTITAVSIPTTSVTISVTPNDDPTNVEFGWYNKGDDTNGDGTIDGKSFVAGDANQTTDFTHDLTNGSCYAWKMFINQANSNGVKMEIKDGNGNVVYTMDGSNEQVFWGVGNFMVDVSSGLAEDELATSLTVFPNPSNGVSNLSIELIDAAEVRYEVTNALGQVVASENLGTVAAGDNQYALNTEHLSNGIYYVNVFVNDNVKTQRLTINK